MKKLSLMKPLIFSCPQCAGQIGLEVDIQNIFGKVKSSLHTNKIVISFAGLLARQVKISGKTFKCLACGKSLLEDTVVLSCPYSGDRDIISNFVILRATHIDSGKKSQPIILHVNHSEEYIKNAEDSGHEVYKRTAKLSLNTEVANG